MKKSNLILGALALISLCTSVPAIAAGKSRSLVLYYSQSGTTEKVAHIFQQKTGADIAAITPVAPYEGSMMDMMKAFSEEQKGTPRALKPLSVDIAAYDTIYLGYPIWGGTYGGPVGSFLKANPLKGKVVIPFCTFGSGGNTSIPQLAQALPEARILPWYGVRQARIGKAEAEISKFLVTIGVLKGEVEAPAPFTEAHPVSEAEKAVFDKACGDYPMPLGTPHSASVSKVGALTNYLFIVNARGMDGKEAQQRIYVVADSTDGSVEFTQVIR